MTLEDRVAETLRRHADDAEPDADLWARIEVDTGKRGRGPLLAAAVAVVVLSAAVAVRAAGDHGGERPPADGPVVVVGRPSVTASAECGFGSPGTSTIVTLQMAWQSTVAAAQRFGTLAVAWSDPAVHITTLPVGLNEAANPDGRSPVFEAPAAGATSLQLTGPLGSAPRFDVRFQDATGTSAHLSVVPQHCPGPPTTTTSAPVVANRRCGNGDLVVTNEPGKSGATGHMLDDYRLTNASTSACWVQGYPTATFLDADGKTVPFVVRQGQGGFMVADAPPDRLDVGPGAAVRFLVEKYRCDEGVMGGSVTMRVVLPGATEAQTVSAGWSYCGPGDSGSIIILSRIMPLP